MQMPIGKSNRKIPACVFMLADHLDAALAAGEDLLNAAKLWEAGDPSDPGVAGVQRFTISRMQAHEMTLLQRILIARERSAELCRADPVFRPMAHLFVSGTEPLAEAAHEVCDPAVTAFETGETATAYLRKRGLIAEDAPGIPAHSELSVDERFLITGRAQLGITLDLVAEFLDALDIRFDLYPEIEILPGSIAGTAVADDVVSAPEAPAADAPVEDPPTSSDDEPAIADDAPSAELAPSTEASSSDETEQADADTAESGSTEADEAPQSVVSQAKDDDANQATDAASTEDGDNDSDDKQAA